MDHDISLSLVAKIDQQLNELDKELAQRDLLLLEYRRLQAARAALSTPVRRALPGSTDALKKTKRPTPPSGQSVNPQTYRREISGREDELKALFLKLRNEDDVITQTGLDPALVRHFADEHIPDIALLRRQRRKRGVLYSDEELLQCIREGARELPSPLPHAIYGEWTRGRQLKDGRMWPGPQAAMLRFGSWRAALLRAGVPAHPTAGPERIFELEDCIGAIAQAWRETGRPPSVTLYESWRADKNATSTKTHPSAPTVRNALRRAGQGWDDLLLTAYALVHGPTLKDSPRDL